MNGQTIAVVHGNNALSLIVVVVVVVDDDDDDVVICGVFVVPTTSAVILLSLSGVGMECWKSTTKFGLWRNRHVCRR